MCVYETTYNNAVNQRDAAEAEIARCNNALSYFDEWKNKISDCHEVLASMVSQNKIIGELCNEIILNGKPIDEGERHYPNGKARRFTQKLYSVKDALFRLMTEVDRQITILDDSLNTSTQKKKAAERTIRCTPKPPCGKCLECNPPAAVVTTTTTTQTNNNTTTTAKTETNNNASKILSNKKFYNTPYQVKN